MRGSNLAGLRFALEAAPLFRPPRGAASFGGALLDGILANLIDGLGEAGGDLLPDSVFLSKLDAGTRNRDVDYRMILGTKSVLDPDQLATVRRFVLARLERTAIGELFAPKIERWLDDLDELVDGEGDGAISIARARLDGVETVLVPLDHLALIKRRGIVSGTPAGEEHPVFRQIATWLDGR